MRVLRLDMWLVATLFALFTASCMERSYKIEVYATNDVHGALFAQNYTGGATSSSLSNVFAYVDSVRFADGRNNVLLFDCGDHLQGDNATYYYNYRDSSGDAHLMSRIFNFMDYDAVVVGNHDIEAGPENYDKLLSELNAPYLAANAVDAESGKTHFRDWTVVEKGGLKIAVLGFTNANVKSWVSPDKYAGMNFVPVEDMAQQLVDDVRRAEKPDLLFVLLHCGLGEQDARNIENDALYLASHIKGADAVFAAHDHRYYAAKVFNGEDSVAVLEGASKARWLSHLSVCVTKKGNRIVGKELRPEAVKMEGRRSSEVYDSVFRQDYGTVNDFSNRVIGRLYAPMDLGYVRNASNEYLSLIHYVQLSQPDVEISITAPLTERGGIEAGDLKFNDLFTLYRFENLLYVVKMSGREVVAFLEEAYEKRIAGKEPKYNYDCAGGLNYIVMESAPKGKRVKISGFADGRRFSEDEVYNVAMTSYRASGAGGLLTAAGIDTGSMEERIVAIYPEIRNILCDFIENRMVVNPADYRNNRKVGSWKMVK